jgi:hypothetical protein
VFLDFLGEFIELSGQVFLFTNNFVVFLCELLELDLEFEDPVFEGLVFGFVVLTAHLMLLELTQKTL